MYVVVGLCSVLIFIGIGSRSGNAFTDQPMVNIETNAVTEPSALIKGVAEGGISIVALGFAAFTFLYVALLTVVGTDQRIRDLKRKLRTSLYATLLAIVAASALSICAFTSIAYNNKVLSDVAIALALFVLLLLSGVASYITMDVYREGRS